jgi:hypothetical protein
MEVTLQVSAGAISLFRCVWKSSCEAIKMRTSLSLRKAYYAGYFNAGM